MDIYIYICTETHKYTNTGNIHIRMYHTHKYTHVDIYIHVCNIHIDTQTHGYVHMVYIYVCGGAHGVMAIVVANRHGDTSSNPGRD